MAKATALLLGCIIDGCPPGIELSEADLQADLDRRKPGQSRYTTQRREEDLVELFSGVFEGKTTGTSIGMMIKNTDQRSKDYGKIKDQFRPAHADYTYMQNTAFAIIAAAAALPRGKRLCGLRRVPSLKSVA